MPNNWNTYKPSYLAHAADNLNSGLPSTTTIHKQNTLFLMQQQQVKSKNYREYVF